jgi:hypothetical protein
MANIKNSEITDTGFLTMPVGSTSQRSNNPSAGMMRFNTTENKYELYDGTEWKFLAFETVANAGEAVFRSVGSYSYTIPNGVNSISVVAVGGGGGGGGNNGSSGPGAAAGGGGGLGWTNDISVSPGSSVNVVVGSGGSPGGTSSNPGSGSES